MKPDSPHFQEESASILDRLTAKDIMAIGGHHQRQMTQWRGIEVYLMDFQE